MKNITVSVDDDLYRRARVKAAEQSTTVSAVVKKYLAEFVQDESEFDRLKRLQDETLAKIRERQKGGPYFSASDRLSREELYDRAALRGHKRSSL